MTSGGCAKMVYDQVGKLASILRHLPLAAEDYYYHENTVANLVSLGQICKEFRVIFNSGVHDAFYIFNDDGTYVAFWQDKEQPLLLVRVWWWWSRVFYHDHGGWSSSDNCPFLFWFCYVVVHQNTCRNLLLFSRKTFMPQMTTTIADIFLVCFKCHGQYLLQLIDVGSGGNCPFYFTSFYYVLNWIFCFSWRREILYEHWYYSKQMPFIFVVESLLTNPSSIFPTWGMYCVTPSHCNSVML